jgi:hypothetical protein
MLGNVHWGRRFSFFAFLFFKKKKAKTTLNLRECENITDISALDNVHTLYLNCTNITDVSMLGNVHWGRRFSQSENETKFRPAILYLRWCDNIRDVSKLGNVHWGRRFSQSENETKFRPATLDLSGCKNISDVSANFLEKSLQKKIGNVNTLYLNFINITNVSKLGNVHTLYLNFTNIDKNKINELKKTVKYLYY